MLRRLTFTFMVAALLSGSSTNGTPFFGDPGDWGTVITFDEYILSLNEVVTDQYASLGVTFSSEPLYEDPITHYGEWKYFYLQEDTNWAERGGQLFEPYGYGWAGSPTTLWIDFTAPVAAVGFNIRSNAGDLLISTYLSGSFVESKSFPFPKTDPLPRGFIGFSGSVFDSISLYIPEDSGMNFDNLSFTYVPAPSAVVLGSIGLSLAGWRLRKYREL